MSPQLQHPCCAALGSPPSPHKLTGLVIAFISAAALAETTAIDERLKLLEDKVRALESGAQKTPVSARPASSSFNPAISLILDGTYATYSQDPASYALPGFALAADTGPRDEGLRLGESELVMSANIDDLFYGRFTAALSPANELEVEEAFFETLTLGHGATLRAGRFFSGIGYLNPQHPHAWDFVDAPLVYRALLGNQVGDDGVQARWVAPTDVFLELGAEFYRGDSFPAGGAAHSGRGTQSYFVHVGGDVGVSHSWRAGISRLNAEAQNRETVNGADTDLFTGSSHITGVDFVWKWAANGNPKTRHVKFQAEYFQREEKGDFDPASTGTFLPYQGTQRCWYAQAVYQFMPRWRAGLRHDALKSSSVDSALAGTVLDNQGHQPARTSVMLDFSNSEFSRLRLQYSRDESRAQSADNQWTLQYTMSLGAHGAHPF
jgi:hypothetical protein